MLYQRETDTLLYIVYAKLSGYDRASTAIQTRKVCAEATETKKQTPIDEVNVHFGSTDSVSLRQNPYTYCAI